MSNAMNKSTVKTYPFEIKPILNKGLVFLLYAYIVICLILALSSLLEFNLMVKINQGMTINPALINKHLAERIAIDALSSLLFLITGVFYFIWLNRADKNALSFLPKETKFTPGWMVGWYFIPIMSFFVPYKGMQELWKVSKNPQNWKNEHASSAVKWWWFFWLLSNLILAGPYIMASQSIHSVKHDLLFIISGSVGQAICAFLLIIIITHINKMQKDAYLKRTII